MKLQNCTNQRQPRRTGKQHGSQAVKEDKSTHAHGVRVRRWRLVAVCDSREARGAVTSQRVHVLMEKTHGVRL